MLRRESSPGESLTLENHLNTFKLRLRTRHDVPAYTLRGYKLRGTFYGPGDIPVERHEVELLEIAAGSETTVDLIFNQSDVPLHIQFDILRPTDWFFGLPATGNLKLRFRDIAGFSISSFPRLRGNRFLTGSLFSTARRSNAPTGIR